MAAVVVRSWRAVLFGTHLSSGGRWQMEQIPGSSMSGRTSIDEKTVVQVSLLRWWSDKVRGRVSYVRNRNNTWHFLYGNERHRLVCLILFFVPVRPLIDHPRKCLCLFILLLDPTRICRLALFLGIIRYGNKGGSVCVCVEICTVFWDAVTTNCDDAILMAHKGCFDLVLFFSNVPRDWECDDYLHVYTPKDYCSDPTDHAFLLFTALA